MADIAGYTRKERWEQVGRYISLAWHMIWLRKDVFSIRDMMTDSGRAHSFLTMGLQPSKETFAEEVASRPYEPFGSAQDKAEEVEVKSRQYPYAGTAQLDMQDKIGKKLVDDEPVGHVFSDKATYQRYETMKDALLQIVCPGQQGAVIIAKHALMKCGVQQTEWLSREPISDI